MDEDEILERIVSKDEINRKLQLIKKHNLTTYKHSLRVALLCIKVGIFYGFNFSDIETLSVAGLLHDIGKIKISNKILDKKTILSKIEEDIIKKHSKYSYELTSDLNNQEIKKIIVAHHEFVQYKPYPRKNTTDYNKREYNMKRVQMSKIVAFCDIFDALYYKRPYRDSVSLEKIEKIMFNTNFFLDEDLIVEILKMLKKDLVPVEIGDSK